MSDPKVPDLPDVGGTPESWMRFMAAVREIMQVREGRRGAAPDEGVTFRDLMALGVAEQSAAGRWIPGDMVGTPGPAGPAGPTGPAGTPYTPDYTPPPTPSGLTVTTLTRGAMVEWDAPTFTQGHGVAYSKVYAAQYVSGPLPTFATATYAGQAGGASTIYVHEAATGAVVHFWITHVSADGVESATPAGGTNGVSVTIGKLDGATEIVAASITNALIQNLAVDNAKIANMSVAKLIAGALAVGEYIQSTGFVSGSAGWRILGSGLAEFDASVIRGLLTASQIDSRGLTIKDAAGYVVMSSGVQRIRGTNLIDPSWWKVGASLQWGSNDANGSVTDFVQATRPDGSSGIVMRATAGASSPAESGPGGGWTPGNYDTLAFPVDKTKEYLFAVYIKAATQGAIPGTAYFGIYSNDVCNINTTTPNANPYFCYISRSSLTGGGWYLFVGKVFPYGSTGNSNTGAGIYDCTTGELIASGTNYCWANIGFTYGSRAYQYYSRGGVQYFSNPQQWVCDGTEPTLSDLLSMGTPSARNQITSSNVGTYIANAAIDYARIASVDAGTISVGTLNAARIGASSITASKLSVSNLAAIAADMGSITAGDITLDSAGFIRGGQTGYQSGTGFWLGYTGGQWKMSIGSGSQGLALDPSAANPVTMYGKVFTSFSVSISGGDISVTVPYGYQTYGSRTVSVSGGTAPYSYQWVGYLCAAGTTSATVTAGGQNDGATNSGRLTVFVWDANGRLATASFAVSAFHYSSGGAGGGSEGGGSG